MQMQVKLPKNYECWAREAFREGDDTIPSHVMGFAYWVLDGRTDAIAGGATPDEAVAMAATIVGADRCDTLVDVVEGPDLETLTSEYEGFLEETKLPGTDAEDLLLTCRAAIPYLSSYIMRWEAAETREHAEEAARLEAERAAKLAEARAMAVCDAVEADFARWQAMRVWCSDLAEAVPHVLDHYPDDEDLGTLKGYVYPDGAFIEEQKTEDGVQYWTVADRCDHLGTLANCESMLWEYHSRHEWPAQLADEHSRSA
jgi:hypothetical protein